MSAAFDTVDRLNRLQAIMNAAARLICRFRRYGHITFFLFEHHYIKYERSIVCLGT